MTDPWAAASAAQTEGGATTQDRLIDAPTSEENIENRLFGGESLPSIWNKTHDVGAEVTGIVKDLPFEKQGRTFVEGGVGKPKFWSREYGQGIVTTASDSIGPLKPVMDLVIPLDTEYRFTPAQLQERGLDEDTGARGWYLSGGEGEQAFKAALKAAKLRKLSDLIGMRITAKRIGKTQKGDFKAWQYAVKVEKA
jgi:hypothetical protein